MKCIRCGEIVNTGGCSCGMTKSEKSLEEITITIKITKPEKEDFEDDLWLITNQLNDGMTSGHNRNQDGEQYQFSLRVEKT